MPFGTIATPIFWSHQQETKTQLSRDPDVKAVSDTKARALLRRLRTGASGNKIPIVVVADNPPSTADSGQLLQPTEQQEPAASPASRPESPSPSPSEADTETETETAAAAAVANPAEEVPVLPAYVARPTATEQPPPYAGQQHALPPALPGYTPLPMPLPLPQEPARDLKQPLSLRRNYREVLRRRMHATKRLFSTDSSHVGGGPGTALDDSESARGVVLYRNEQDRWVGASDTDEIDDIKFMQAKQTGLKGWLKRVWAGIKEFMEEHPMLFFIALFVIIVVALCVLI